MATPLHLRLSLADRARVNPPVSQEASDEELVRAAQSGDRATLAKYGRFLAPILQIMIAR
ncbi:MAG TPA: hypothetical protein VKP58_15695 [Candidatus Acidoferrum sp.]|nr:hypothetical protein [Candidatus Acidoferrum sp.]